MFEEEVKAAGEQLTNVCTFAQKMQAVARVATTRLKSSALNQVSEEVKQFNAWFKAKIDEAETIPGILPEDLSVMTAQKEDLREIESRKAYNDIRSWDASKIQRDDALQAIENIRSYWKKLSDTLTGDAGKSISERSVRGQFTAVPNYRFKIGQMVKTKKGNKVGKVVGLARENGTGRAIYTVRLVSDDKTKNYYTGEIKVMPTE
jgi:hypothetical protein